MEASMLSLGGELVAKMEGGLTAFNFCTLLTCNPLQSTSFAADTEIELPFQFKLRLAVWIENTALKLNNTDLLILM